MKRARGLGRRLTPRQAAINLAQQTKEATKPRRYVGRVADITDRETTGTVTCVSTVSEFAVTVQVRANIDLDTDDLIWIREDPGTQGTYVFDGFVKGGGVGNNLDGAPIPWTQTPGVIAPPGQDLNIQAPPGRSINIPSPITGIELNDIEDVNATPDDGDCLTWVAAASEWQAAAGGAGGGWPFSGKVLTVDSADADADYATLAAAVAAADAGDVILMSAETHTVNNVTLPNSVHLAGFGPEVTILQTSTQDVCLRVGDGSLVMNLSVKNTRAAANTYAVYMSTSTDTSRFINVRAAVSGATSVGCAFYVGGSTELIDCWGEVASGTYRYGLNAAGTGTIRITNGYYSGPGYRDILAQQAALLVNPVLADGLLVASGSGTFQGPWIDASGRALKDRDRVKNTSGAAVATGAVGYIDSIGEFKTTTTAYLDATWCVVLVGGANNADIYVAQRGRVTATLNGNCSAGNYLYTSTTAGQAQPESYVRPELFAVALTANASGAGGTCQALLLCNTTDRYVTNADDVYFSHFASKVSDLDWSGTIQALPGGAVVRYTTTGGTEDNLRPQATTQLAKIRLYNSTRGTYALISDNDPTGGAGYDGAITLTAAVPAGWVVGDAITIRSQTNTSTFGTTGYFVDMEITAGISTLARSIEMEMTVSDTGGSGQGARVHPWEANAASKRFGTDTQAANTNNVIGVPVSLIQRRFCLTWQASGSSTAMCRLKLAKELIAAP